MTGTLDRITTEYIDTEAHARLAGHNAAGSTVVIWLTQYLIRR